MCKGKFKALKANINKQFITWSLLQILVKDQSIFKYKRLEVVMLFYFY